MRARVPKVDCMQDNELATQMLSRVRRHLIISYSGVLCAVGSIAAAAVVGRAIFDNDVPKWFRPVVVITGLAMIPTIGFWSTFKMLRCPSCNGLVGWQTNNQLALFSRHKGKECRHCGKTIFDDRVFTDFKIQAAVIVVLTLVFFFGLAVLRRH